MGVIHGRSPTRISWDTDGVTRQICRVTIRASARLSKDATRGCAPGGVSNPWHASSRRIQSDSPTAAPQRFPFRRNSPAALAPRATAPSADTRPRRELVQGTPRSRERWLQVTAGPKGVLSPWGDAQLWGGTMHPCRQLPSISRAFPRWEKEAVALCRVVARSARASPCPPAHPGMCRGRHTLRGGKCSFAGLGHTPQDTGAPQHSSSPAASGRG